MPSSAMTWRAALAAALAGEAGEVVAGLASHAADRILYVEVGAGLGFMVALVALSRARLPRRGSVLLILGFAALLQLLALTSAPTASDDAYRYVWDAKVQLHGIDPYRYPPSASALSGLRSRELFPDRRECSWHLPDGRCSLLNRPGVRTVYPPVAQGAFSAARLATFGRTDGPRPLQVSGALGVLALSVLLARRAIAERRPLWTVAVWAWCPITAVELTNNAHIDWLAALLSVVALMASGAGRHRWAGIAIGAAIATKLYPALLLPVMIRRRPRTVLVAATAVLGLSYLPHVAAVGAKVIGYLPGYLHEENYLQGSRFALVGAALPPGVAAVAAVAVMLAVALYAVRRVDNRAPEETGLVVMGAALLVATPAFSWYCVLLIALVAMTGKVEWLPVAFACTIAALGSAHFGQGFRTLSYLLALGLLLLGMTARRLTARKLSATPMSATPPDRPGSDDAIAAPGQPNYRAVASAPASRAGWQQRGPP